MEQLKIYYPSFGRAGKEVLEKLIDKGISKENILIHTHDLQDNELYLEFLIQNKFHYYLDEQLKDDSILSFNPDYTLSIHYRKLISEVIVNKIPGINLHPSLLPRYAGCLSVMWQIINGEKETGITYHLLNREFDRGNIIHQVVVPLKDIETGETLYNRLIDLGVKEFDHAFDKLVQGQKGNPQIGEFEYYSRKLPNKGLICFEWDDNRVERFIRAFTFKDKLPAHVIKKNKKVFIHNFQEYLEIKK